MAEIPEDFREILSNLIQKKVDVFESNVFQPILLKVVSEHISVLIRKRKQLVYINDYGALVKDDWFRELESFLNFFYLKEVEKESMSALFSSTKSFLLFLTKEDEAIQRMKEEGMLPYDSYPENYYLTMDSKWWMPKDDKDRVFPEKFEIFETGYIIKELSDLVRAADLAVEDYLNGLNGKESYLFSFSDIEEGVVVDTVPVDLIKDGYEYEAYCAELLESLGWRVEVRKKSGDQGADLIGNRFGYRVVFQCKFYSSPVGNKAVQEAIAGMVFEQADYGVVVTNSTFTKQARQLAEVADIYLFHHDELKDFFN